MKKISFMLVIALLLTAISPMAFANQASQYNAVQRSYAQQYTIETDIESLMQDANGNYAMVIADEKPGSQTYIPVGRQDVLLTSEDSVKKLQSIEGLGQELKDDVIEMAQYAQTHEEYDCNTVSIYSPELLSDSNNGVYYRFYDGHRMKVEFTVSDFNTPFATIASGNSFERVLSSITNVALENGVSTVLSAIFGPASSLMQAIYKDAAATNVSASSSNMVEVKIRGSRVRQYTFGELQHMSGNWLLGCVSSSVTIEEYVFSYDFYTSGGKRKAAGELNILKNQTINSQNYTSGHTRTAWLNLSHPWVDEGIRVKIGNKYFNLT